MEQFGAICSVWKLFGAMWSDLERVRDIWSHLVPFGAILSNLEHFGAFWIILEPFGAILINLEPFEPFPTFPTLGARLIGTPFSH